MAHGSDCCDPNGKAFRNVVFIVTWFISAPNSDVLRPSIYIRLQQNTSCVIHSENIPPHLHVQSSLLFYRVVNNVMQETPDVQAKGNIFV